ncbi:hypothetical protein CBR_g20009 [Chara braunii]|uniref:Uncharacterized protein n=1 Tax=Chara braunii TaxID=69332 RepID=A0A388KZA6_CHABU|nr:hypothetical protein CBR_g20009 [Chara braunii]|eukprot:GBG75379.1 hypothetical protein CBR_g20009 [Chara braunii]
MWGFVSKEMEEKERLMKEREKKQKEEEEKKRQQEKDEKRQKEQQEKVDFQANLGKLIKRSMVEVCESILGKKVAPTENVCVEIDIELRRQAIAAGKKPMQEDKQESETERLRRENEEMKIAMRISFADKEIDSLKQENAALSRGIIELREEINALKKGEKRNAGDVMEKSPPTEPARAKVRVADRELTPCDIAKMADAYRRFRDDKDYAEREVAALKERINRLKVRTSPPVVRRRFALRSAQPTNLRKKMALSVDELEEDADAENNRPKIRFEKRGEENRSSFTKRVFLELSKLRKSEIGKLCLQEGLAYTTIRGSAADLAERYASVAFPRLRRVIRLEEEKEGEKNDDQSIDLAAGEPSDREEVNSDC